MLDMKMILVSFFIVSDKQYEVSKDTLASPLLFIKFLNASFGSSTITDHALFNPYDSILSAIELTLFLIFGNKCKTILNLVVIESHLSVFQSSLVCGFRNVHLSVSIEVILMGIIIGV